MVFPQDLNENMMSNISSRPPSLLPSPQNIAKPGHVRAATGILAHSFCLVAGNHL